MSRSATRRAAAAFIASLAILIPLMAAPFAQGGPSPTDWVAFEGRWSATGRRQTLPTEGPGSAAIVRLSGALSLSSGTEVVGGGLLGEAIGYDDGTGTTAGRSVWTDSKGNRVFSSFTAETIGTGRRVTGTITGGTGRFTGIVGEYTLTWQYVVQGEDDTVQGRSVDVKGRIRRGSRQP